MHANCAARSAQGGFRAPANPAAGITGGARAQHNRGHLLAIRRRRIVPCLLLMPWGLLLLLSLGLLLAPLLPGRHGRCAADLHELDAMC